MFQSLKVVGMCAVLLGVECSDAMQVEEQEQSSSLQKVEVALPETGSLELTDIGNIESSLESPMVTEDNQVEKVGQEEVNQVEGIQNPSEIEEEISENTTEDQTDTGVVLSDSEEIVQQPENLTEETNLEENIPTESISEPENVNPIEEIQNPEESISGEIDLGETNTEQGNSNLLNEIPTESTTEVEESVPSAEEESPEGSTTEIDEDVSGIESGSESEYEESISIRIMRIFTVIKDRSIGFFRRILNLFF